MLPMRDHNRETCSSVGWLCTRGSIRRIVELYYLMLPVRESGPEIDVLTGCG
jgi:hypothetical protein